VISRPADAAKQRTEHVVRELLKPVNGKAEDALRLPALLALRPCSPRRILRLPGWPGIGVTLEREAEDPVSLFLTAGHKSASEIAGHRQSLAWLIGPGQDNAAPGAAGGSVTDSFWPTGLDGSEVTAIPPLGHRAGRLSG
jgi:hypothetical protein